MAKNALYILEDSARLEQFKIAARKHAEQFSIEAVLPFYERIYEQLNAVRDK
jgi:L-malate glycosyltransferase